MTQPQDILGFWFSEGRGTLRPAWFQRDETFDAAIRARFGERAQALARQSLLLEEFLAREAAAGRLDTLRAQLRPLQQPVLVHGHCHQKAFGAVSPVLEVLKLVPGLQPQLVESSCCGMAGSFGYEAKHHAVSMQMAELSLLPAGRSAPGAIVGARGTSRRPQIHHGAQREAIHAAVLLAGAL